MRLRDLQLQTNTYLYSKEEAASNYVRGHSYANLQFGGYGAGPNLFRQFRSIGMKELLHNAPPVLGYAKSYHVENCELLYKIFRGDTKLVRSLLEAN